MAQLFLGKIPEAVYFALFIILAKNKKIFDKKSFLFICNSILAYLCLKYMFPFNSWFQFVYLFVLFVNTHFFWKNSNVVDFMNIIINFIWMIITSILCFVIVGMFTSELVIISLIHKIILFAGMYICRNKFKRIKIYYNKYWNRNDLVEKKILSITFRTINVIAINLTFVIINLCMIYAVIFNGR